MSNGPLMTARPFGRRSKGETGAIRTNGLQAGLLGDDGLTGRSLARRLSSRDGSKMLCIGRSTSGRKPRDSVDAVDFSRYV